MALKYTIIKNRKQYDDYCNKVEKLLDKPQTKPIRDEIDLLTLLIELYDAEHNTFEDVDPVELVSFLMEQNNLKAQNLADILGVDKSLISQFLNYKRGLSKDVIRKLSEHFKVSQTALNRKYNRKPSTGIITYVEPVLLPLNQPARQTSGTPFLAHILRK